MFIVAARAVRIRLLWASGGTAELAQLCEVANILGILFLLVVVGAAIRGPYRVFARVSLVYNLLLIVALIGLSEILLPLPVPPTHAQELLIEQLRRRHEELNTPYHGSLFVPGKANDLGWLDREHDFKKTAPRLLFIGDSMLEVRSRRRLALRLEDRLGVEVVNLSMTGSDPLDYRFRLNEYAFDYEPDHIFVFLYGPNDFSLEPPYAPYRPPPVRVTRQTVECAGRIGLPAKVVERLRALEGGPIYPTRATFLEAVGGALNQSQSHLLYTAGVAYSDAETRQFLHSARTRIQNVGTRLVEVAVRWQLGQPDFPDPQWWGTQPFQERVKQVYRLPRQQRLVALGRLFAETMNTPAGPILGYLQSQTPEFREWLIAEPDMLWFVAIPLNRLAGLLDPPKPKTEMSRLEGERVALYRRLLAEMADTARGRGCRLTYVFIPTPGLADRDFVRFWNGQPPTEWSVPVYQAVLAAMKGQVSLIDLGTDPDRFRGGYWPLDGHWTDRANDEVADILAEFLATTKAVRF